LYARLYTGTATADQVLRAVIAPVAEVAAGSGAVDRWFFVRYGDPEWHVRVRFHGPPERLWAEVLPALHAAAAPLLDDGRIWRVQLDTYEREVERYGGADGIALSEQLFHIDSEAVLAIVERLAGDAGAEARWRLLVRGMDLLLIDLGLDTAARHTVIRHARDGYLREFRADANLKRQLGTIYRNERKGLEALLDPSNDQDSPLAPGFAALRNRSDRLAPIVAMLQEYEQANRLSPVLIDLAPSYLHMHANRLLRSSHRAQELVVYELLDRIYQSRAARARKGG
jgi:thiopeptide-type bacteriocin biosynthesis protein